VHSAVVMQSASCWFLSWSFLRSYETSMNYRVTCHYVAEDSTLLSISSFRFLFWSFSFTLNFLGSATGIDIIYSLCTLKLQTTECVY
jgi:hypothetical protein